MGHAWRVRVWCLGVLLLLLSVLTAFVGYVLPWGQMSFWGATVITSLASALPVVGYPLVSWLWGGLSVENATLNRFLSLHYLLPFIIAGNSVVHLAALHEVGSNHPLVGAKPGGQERLFHRFTHKGPCGLSRVGHRCRPGCFRNPNRPRPPRQLDPRQPTHHASAHRARVVFFGFVCHPEKHPQQACRGSRCYPGNHHLVPYWRSARSFRYRDALWPRCPPGLRGLGRSGPRFEPSSVSKRWLLSTNPKEMGSLYLLVAYEAGVDGTLFSMLVRTELSSSLCESCLQCAHHCPRLFDDLLSDYACFLFPLCRWRSNRRGPRQLWARQSLKPSA